MKVKINIRLTIDNNYVVVQNYLKDKDFVFCCDLLKLKEYEEFKKRIKNKYYVYDNFSLVMETINANDAEHFKYIETYIKLEYINDITLYCYMNNLNNIADYLLLQCKNFDYENCAYLSGLNGYIYFIIKYNNHLNFNKYDVNNKMPWVMQYGTLKEIQFMQKKGIKFCYNVYAMSTVTIDKLAWLHKNNLQLRKDSTKIIIQTNNVIILKYLLKHKYKITRDMFLEAIKFSSLEIVKLVYDNLEVKKFASHFKKCIQYYSIQRGNIQILEFLHEKKIKFSNDSMNNIKANKKNVLLFLKNIKCPLLTKKLQLNAISNNDIPLLSWLINLKSFRHKDSLYLAIKNNNLKMVKFMYEHKWEFDNHCFNIACEKTDIKLIKYIHDKCGITIESFKLCILFQPLETIKSYIILANKKIKILQINEVIHTVKNIDVAIWLINSIYITNKSKILLCVTYNLIDKLEQFLKIEKKLNIEDMIHAMGYNNIEVVKLFIKYKCETSINIFYNHDSHIGIVKLLLNYYIKTNHKLGIYLFYNIASFGNIELIELLLDLKCPKNYDWLNSVVRSHNYNTLNYYFDKGYKLSYGAYEILFENNGWELREEMTNLNQNTKDKIFKMVCWLTERKCEWAYELFSYMDNLDEKMVRWLIDNGYPHEDEILASGIEVKDFIKYIKKYN